MIEGKELTEYSKRLPEVSAIDENVAEREEIRIYEPNRRYEILKTLGVYWRFVALTAALAAIFFVFYNMFFENKTSFSDDEVSKLQESDAYENEEPPLENLEASLPVILSPPVLIDEARSDINIDDFFKGEDNSCNIFNTGGGIKVLIVHAHSSEKVSQSMSVIDAGDAIVQLLISSGIGAMHCTVLHDEGGKVGAYNRMKGSIEELKEDYPELVLIIDLHGSESDKPFLFDIGVSPEYAWKENLLIVSAVYNNMDRTDCTVRLLPQNLGQNNGILTFNVSLGYDNADELFVRELIADLALGITSLFIENTPA